MLATDQQIIKKKLLITLIEVLVLIVMPQQMIPFQPDGRNSALTYQHPETYTGLTLTAYDVDFGGTSSACPTAAGWITTKLQYNRAWLWSDIKTWLKNQCGPQNPAKFYMGGDQTSWSATDDNWRDAHGTNNYGTDIVVIWDAPTGSPSEPQKPEIRLKSPGGLTITNGLEIKFT